MTTLLEADRGHPALRRADRGQPRCASRSTQGAAVGLIGANGAGKTTLFNCLTGFDKPTSGDVRLRGRSLLKLARHKVVRAGVARTFQIVRPFPDLPGAGQRARAADRRRARGRPAAKALAVLERVGLADRAASPRRSCRRVTSSGWRWRGRSPPGPGCCCSTSPSPACRSPRSSSCPTRSASCARRASPSSSSSTRSDR